jgi:hypothetical protein
MSRSIQALSLAAASVLAVVLWVGGCSGGRTGFTVYVKGFGVSVTAAYCHA